MMSNEYEQTIQRTVACAKKYGHRLIVPEHMLLALLDDAEGRAALDAAQVDVESLRDLLEKYLREQVQLVTENANLVPRLSQATNLIQRDLQEDLQANRIFEINGCEALRALLEHECAATDFLTALGYDYETAKDISKRGAESYKRAKGQQPQKPDIDADTDADIDAKTAPVINLGGDALQEYCPNLNQRALDGKIDPVIGREAEIDRAVQTLCRRSKCNPVFVGDPGVGKTAIVEGMARLINEGKVPPSLKDAQIFSLDIAALVAGTTFRGDFEKRMKAVLAELEAVPNPILFMDEMHMMMGAGAAGSNVDIANILKPALAGRGLRFIGATTHDEFRKHIEKDAALVRRLQKITISEPSAADTKKILKRVVPQFEAHHGVKYTAAALDRAVDLAGRYLHARKFPDKALDVIDEAGAAQSKLPENKRRKRIDVKQVETVIAAMANVPASSMSDDDEAVLRHLESELKAEVYDQDPAIEALTDAIKFARAGLREGNKPIGSYLFSGPTGVGKTEVTRKLAEKLGVPLVRFDMSEYMERHTVSRLIGAPPGYVGFDQAGLLTNEIDQKPHCVLLLDEIEKAHPDLFNILLQVMDHGKLTDNNGKKVDFSNVVLVMTTNAGAADMQKESIGFHKSDDRSDKSAAAIAALFPPEFRNRLDAVVPFQHLKPTTMGRIVDKFVGILETQLAERSQGRINLELSAAARDWLAVAGYDRTMGARPMGRTIHQHVKKPLVDEILFGQLKKGGTASFDVAADGKGLHVAFARAAAGAPTANDNQPQEAAPSRKKSGTKPAP